MATFVIMPSTAETSSLGQPVEIEDISSELKKLWQAGEGAMTRASLINFAVYSEKPGSLNTNTQSPPSGTIPRATRKGPSCCPADTPLR